MHDFTCMVLCCYLPTWYTSRTGNKNTFKCEPVYIIYLLVSCYIDGKQNLRVNSLYTNNSRWSESRHHVINIYILFLSVWCSHFPTKIRQVMNKWVKATKAGGWDIAGVDVDLSDPEKEHSPFPFIGNQSYHLWLHDKPAFEPTGGFIQHSCTFAHSYSFIQL